MPLSEAAAHEALTLVTQAGGSWWLGFVEGRPRDETELAAADVCPIAPTEVPRDAATWTTPTGRAVWLEADHVSEAATGACSPGAWVLYDDEAMTDPQHWGFVAANSPGVPSGSTITLAASTVNLRA